MADGKVVIDVVLSDGSVVKGVADIGKAFGSIPGQTAPAEKSTSGFLDSVKRIATGVGAVQLVGKAISTITGQVGNAVKRFDTLNNSQRVFSNMGFTANATSAMMKQLNKDISGLPTSLDGAVTGVQMFASSIGDVEQSGRVFAAVNDAILGFGGSTADVQNAVMQMSQAFANGKVDGQTWISMMNSNMGPALGAIAKQMGLTTGQLQDGLSSGKISVQQFQQALIDLDKNGGGGLKSLHEIALGSTQGIGTAFQNMRTGIVRGLTNVLGSLDKLAIAVTGNSIAQMIQQSGQRAEGALNALAAGITKATPAIQSFFKFIADHQEILKTLSVSIAAAVTALAGLKMANSVASGFGFMIGSFSQAGGAANIFLFALKNVTAEAGPVKGLTMALKTLGINPFALLIAGIAAVVAGLTYFFTRTETGRAAWARITSEFQKVLPVLAAVKNWFSQLADSIGQFISSGLQRLGPLLSAVGTWFRQLGTAIAGLMSAGIQRLGAIFGSIGDAASNVGERFLGVSGGIKAIIGAGLGKVAELFSSLGGKFGAIGTVAGLVASALSKVGLAALGITGPWGMLASLVTSFLISWAKTGELNASGITQVFDNLSSTITNVANGISTYLPQFVEVGTKVITGLINGITAAIPGIVSSMTTVITSITGALTTALPQLTVAGTQILTGLIGAITQALPQLITAATTIVTSLLQAILSALPLLIGAGLQIMMGIVQALITALPILIQAAIQIMTALMNGLIIALPLLIQAAIQIMMALVNGLITALPQLLTAALQIIMALVNGLITMLPMLIQAAIQIIMALVNGLIAALPQIINAGIQILMALITGIIQILPQLIAAALQIIMALFGALIDNLPKIIDAGIQLLMALINGLIQIIPQLIAAAFQIIGALFGALIENAPKILSAGVQLIKALISGLVQLIGEVIGAAGKIGKSIFNKIKEIDLLEVGKNIIKGLINGIGSMIGAVGKVIGDIAGKITGGIKGLLGIHSPSKVMAKIGDFVGQGLVNGMDSTLSAVEKASSKLASAATFEPDAFQMPDTLAALTSGRIGVNQTLAMAGVGVPTSQTVNHINSVINNGDSDAALGLLQQIADKSTVIDGSSVARGLAPFSSNQQAIRTVMAERGAAVDTSL